MPALWPHTDCGCRHDIKVGERYRRLSADYETGREFWWACTVEEIEPLRHDKLFCPRIHMRGDDGRVSKPQPQDVAARYQRIDNVVSFPARAA